MSRTTIGKTPTDRPTTYDQDTNGEKGDKKTPAKNPTGNSHGCTKTADTQRIPPNRRHLFPKNRKGIQGTHSQIARVCQSIDKTLGSLSKQDQSKALLELIFGRAKAPKHGSLGKEVESLRQIIHFIPRNFLASLEQVAQGKTAKVLLEVESQNVYKVIEIEDGLVGGTFPGEIRHRKHDNQILVNGCQRHSLIDCISAVLISNKQGMVLKTQIAGFTEDLGVVFKQPYIHDLQPLPLLDEKTMRTSKALQKAIRNLGMLLVGDIGSPFAIAPAGTKLAIFDDLHGDNILLDEEKKPVLVDSLATRYLKPKEIKIIKDCLLQKHKASEKEGDIERILSYFDHKKLNGHFPLESFSI
jgi:hypothetical protein